MTDTPYLIGVLGAIDEMRDPEDIPRLTAALRDVLKAHRATWDPTRCGGCGQALPCSTCRAVSRALLGDKAASLPNRKDSP